MAAPANVRFKVQSDIRFEDVTVEAQMKASAGKPAPANFKNVDIEFLNETPFELRWRATAKRSTLGDVHLKSADTAIPAPFRAPVTPNSAQGPYASVVTTKDGTVLSEYSAPSSVCVNTDGTVDLVIAVASGPRPKPSEEQLKQALAKAKKKSTMTKPEGDPEPEPEFDYGVRVQLARGTCTILMNER